LKLPKKFRVTSKVSYLIAYVQSIDSEEGTKTYGYCDPNTKQIILSMDQSETEMMKTFIHECFHSIEEEYGVKVPHKVVHILEVAIFKVLKLNGWLK